MKPIEEKQYKFLHATRGDAWFNEKNIELCGGVAGMAREGWTLVEDTIEKQPLPANVIEIMQAGEKKRLETVLSLEPNDAVEDDPNGEPIKKEEPAPVKEEEVLVKKVIKKGGRPPKKR